MCLLSTPGCGAIYRSMVHLWGHILEVNELSWLLPYGNLKEKMLNLPYGFKGLESMMVELKNSWEFTPLSITMRQRETLGIAWDFHTSIPTQQWCIFFSKATPPNPKQFYQPNWGPNSQTYEPIGPFSSQPPHGCSLSQRSTVNSSPAKGGSREPLPTSFCNVNWKTNVDAVSSSVQWSCYGFYGLRVPLLQ